MMASMCRNACTFLLFLISARFAGEQIGGGAEEPFHPWLWLTTIDVFWEALTGN